jgi:hypothetical protein
MLRHEEGVSIRRHPFFFIETMTKPKAPRASRTPRTPVAHAVTLRKLLSAAEILNAPVPFEYVQVPEWGGTVRVQAFTGSKREEWSRGVGSSDDKDDGTAMARLLVYTCVDESGVPLFSLDDVLALSKASSVALERIVRVAIRLCGLGATAVETAEKN